MDEGSIYGCRAVMRLVKLGQDKYHISQEIMDEMNSCIMCVLNNIDFFHSKATKVFPPEWEFHLKGANYHAKGFLDDLAIYGTGSESTGCIRDWKTMGLSYKTEAELMEEFGIQATMYQLAVYKHFGVLSTVEFYLVRYPPTAKKPTRHIRVIPAKSVDELRGYEMYLEYFGNYLKNFGIPEAMSNFAADDEKGKRFCQYICKFKQPMDYIAHVGADGKTIKGYFPDDTLPQLKEGETLEERHYGGCPRFGGRI